MVTFISEPEFYQVDFYFHFSTWNQQGECHHFSLVQWSFKMWWSEYLHQNRNCLKWDPWGSPHAIEFLRWSSRISLQKAPSLSWCTPWSENPFLFQNWSLLGSYKVFHPSTILMGLFLVVWCLKLFCLCFHFVFDIIT